MENSKKIDLVSCFKLKVMDKRTNEVEFFRISKIEIECSKIVVDSLNMIYKSFFDQSVELVFNDQVLDDFVFEELEVVPNHITFYFYHR